MMNRREFCKKAMIMAGGLALPLTALEVFNPKRLHAEKDGKGKVRWVFLVDVHKCVGCGFCVKACKIENDVAWDANVTRTWVERYVVTKDGQTLHRFTQGSPGWFHHPEDRPGPVMVSRRLSRKRSPRASLFPSSATIARILPAFRSVR